MVSSLGREQPGASSTLFVLILEIIAGGAPRARVVRARARARGSALLNRGIRLLCGWLAAAASGAS